MFPSIPGSKRDRSNEPLDPTAAGLSSGRFTEAQLIMLAELTEWWSYRRSQDDSSEPLQSLIGGIDIKGTARTIGLTTSAATFSKDIAPKTNNAGSSYFVHALGIPDPPVVGEVYSLLGICHFYYITGTGFLSRYTTIARAPSSTTSTEISAAIDGGTGDGQIKLTGVSSITIDWTIDLFRLEL